MVFLWWWSSLLFPNRVVVVPKFLYLECLEQEANARTWIPPELIQKLFYFFISILSDFFWHRWSIFEGWWISSSLILSWNTHLHGTPLVTGVAVSSRKKRLPFNGLPYWDRYRWVYSLSAGTQRWTVKAAINCEGNWLCASSRWLGGHTHNCLIG